MFTKHFPIIIGSIISIILGHLLPISIICLLYYAFNSLPIYLPILCTYLRWEEGEMSYVRPIAGMGCPTFALPTA